MYCVKVIEAVLNGVSTKVLFRKTMIKACEGGKKDIRSYFYYRKYYRPSYSLISFLFGGSCFTFICKLEEYCLFHRRVDYVGLFKVEFVEDFVNIYRLGKFNSSIFSILVYLQSLIGNDKAHVDY